MLRDNQNPKALWLKAIVLLLALIGVFWIMSSLRKNPEILAPVSEEPISARVVVETSTTSTVTTTTTLPDVKL